MKTKLLFFTIAFLTLCVSFNVQADNKKTPKEETVVFNVPMDCEGCRTKIIGYMSYEKGVKNLDANLEQQTVTITYNPKRTNKENLIAAFEKLDKKAVEVKQGGNYTLSALQLNARLILFAMAWFE